MGLGGPAGERRWWWGSWGQQGEGEWASDPSAAWPGALKRMDLGQEAPSPARVSCPMFHSSWGQLQAPYHSGLLKTRTGNGERCLTNTQNTGEKPHPLSSPRRIAGGIMGSEQRPPARPSHAQQDTPQRPLPPREMCHGSHCWGPRPCQWSLGPEAPGPVCIFTAIGSGRLGTSARSPEQGGGGPTPLLSPGRPLGRPCRLSCHPHPRRSTEGGERGPGQERQMDRQTKGGRKEGEGK